jgi:hypothetical protein
MNPLDLHPLLGGRCRRSHEAYLQVYLLVCLPIFLLACPKLSHQAVASLAHLSGLHGETGACLACHGSGMAHQAWLVDLERTAQQKRAWRFLDGEGWLNLSAAEWPSLHCFV